MQSIARLGLINRYAVGLCLGWLLLVSPAAAQYTAPGTVVPTNRIPEKETFEEAVENAWKNVGGLRLQPWLAITDAALVQLDGVEETDDFTVTVGAGVRAYLPIGGKSYLVGHTLPEYVWWSDNEDRRRLNGRYGLGYFGYFNRLQVEASWRQAERQRFFSNEVRVLTTQNVETLRLATSLELGRRLSLVGRYQQRDSQQEVDEIQLLSLLDREETTTYLGVQYEAPSNWVLGLGYEDRDNDLSPGGRLLSNSGYATKVEVEREGNQFSGRMDLAFLSLEGDDGSIFPQIDEVVGGAGLLWTLSRRFEVLNFLRRELFYALDPDSTHYFSERAGVRVTAEGRPLDITFIAEIGEDDYESPFGLVRSDDVLELGLALAFTFRNNVGFEVSVRQTDYDSPIPEFDRTITSVGFRVELGEILEIRIGETDTEW